MIYHSPQLSLYLDPKREAEGKITVESNLAAPINQTCKFKVSKSGGKVIIVFTSLSLPPREVARVSGVSESLKTS